MGHPAGPRRRHRRADALGAHPGSRHRVRLRPADRAPGGEQPATQAPLADKPNTGNHSASPVTTVEQPAAKAAEEPPRSTMSQADIDKANDEARKAAIAAALGETPPEAPKNTSPDFVPSANPEGSDLQAPTNPIPTEATGFKIQLLDVEEPITLSNPLFKAYKSLYAEVASEKHYTYLIGDYKSKVSAEAILKKISKQYPDAKIIEYADGKRVE